LEKLALSRAKYRTAIGDVSRLAGRGGGEMLERDGDRELGPKAQLSPPVLSGEIELAAEFLAQPIEKNSGGQEQRGLAAKKSRSAEFFERPPQALVDAGDCALRHGSQDPFWLRATLSKRRARAHAVSRAKVKGRRYPRLYASWKRTMSSSPR